MPNTKTFANVLELVMKGMFGGYKPKHARHRTAFERKYRIIGILMGLFPVAGFALSWLMGEQDSVVFFVEAAGIWTFAAYWLVKSTEMALSEHGEKEVADKKQKRENAMRSAPPQQPNSPATP